MAVQVVPGVWWMERTRGCNVYLARATDGSYVIVDAGFVSCAQAIVEQARRIAGDAPVTHVLLTHDHFDHVAAAGEVARALGASVALGRGDCEPTPEGGWRVEYRPMRTGRLRGLAQRLMPPLSTDDPIPVHVPIDARCEIAPGIEAIPTPGHTPGSTCFVMRASGEGSGDSERVEGVAFVGDLVISHRDGLARSLAAANRDDAAYLEMLRAFAAEAPEVGLAGHGYPVRHGFGQSLRELAELPREPLNARNAWRRFRRIARFNMFLWMQDQPRRR